MEIQRGSGRYPGWPRQVCTCKGHPHIKLCTVRCRYSTVKFLPHTVKKHPIIVCPWGWGMLYPLWFLCFVLYLGHRCVVCIMLSKLCYKGPWLYLHGIWKKLFIMVWEMLKITVFDIRPVYWRKILEKKQALLKTHGVTYQQGVENPCHWTLSLW